MYLAKGAGCCLGTQARGLSAGGALAPPHRASWASSQHGGWVLRASVPSCMASSDLALEIMPHHVCFIVSIKLGPAHIQGDRNYTPFRNRRRSKEFAAMF